MANVSSQILKRKLKAMGIIAAGGGLVCGAIGFYKGDEKMYKNILMPLVRTLDPERAHRLAVLSAKYGVFRQAPVDNADCLKTTLWGLEFCNPIGMAAGFDKHGEAVNGLYDMGFGFVEVGSVTPEPQPGNPRPRVFRLVEDKGVINRYGFNSDGHKIVSERLKSVYFSTRGILGINLGKNKMSSNAIDDYVKGIECFASLADFLVINVSSPNTPGLRNMQGKNALEGLVRAAVQTRDNLQLTKRVPILIKIAPDLTYEECKDIVDVVLSQKIDGIIISNTTTSRPESLKSSFKNEVGGLSGSPLRKLSTETIKNVHRLTKGKVPIIGVGGISSGEDAYEKIRAGASLIELYTAMVYEGPPVITKIKRELIELLKRDGFSSLTEAVGADHKI